MERNDRSYRKTLKEDIIRTASVAFRDNGIKKVTMDDIAALLKISKRTLYEVFADKEDLLEAVIIYNHIKNREFTERIWNESSNVLEVILKFLEVSVTFLQKTNKNVFTDLKKYPAACKLKQELRAKESDRQIEFFKLGVKQGLFRDDINFAILSVLINEQFALLLNSEICTDFSYVEVFESISFTFIRGITTEKGVRLLNEFIAEHRQLSKEINQ